MVYKRTVADTLISRVNTVSRATCAKANGLGWPQHSASRG